MRILFKFLLASAIITSPRSDYAAPLAICPGVIADDSGKIDASAAIQTCLDRLPVWVMPDGIYKLGTALDIKRPIAWSGNATLIADANIRGTALHDMVKAGYVNHVSLRGLTFDGNRTERDTRFCDGTVNAYGGSNLLFDHVDDAHLEGITSRNAVCGSALQFSGNRALIRGNTFEANGEHRDKRWADGLTLLQCKDCEISANRFINNSDVALIFGGGRNTRIHHNQITQTTRAFAGVMFDNFNGSQSGDFRGAELFDNIIDCACDFGINIGPHAWYLGENTLGGSVHDNIIRGAKIGILVDGAGSAAYPVHLANNTITPLGVCGTSESFLCGRKAACAIKISGDAFVNPQPPPVLMQDHHRCP